MPKGYRRIHDCWQPLVTCWLLIKKRTRPFKHCAHHLVLLTSVVVVLKVRTWQVSLTLAFHLTVIKL